MVVFLAVVPVAVVPVSVSVAVADDVVSASVVLVFHSAFHWSLNGSRTSGLFRRYQPCHLPSSYSKTSILSN